MDEMKGVNGSLQEGQIKEKPGRSMEIRLDEMGIIPTLHLIFLQANYK